jgi:hypothetical protein
LYYSLDCDHTTDALITGTSRHYKPPNDINMAETIASDHVNHFGRVNHDHVCHQPSGQACTLPKDTTIVIMDVNSSADRFVIWWPTENLFSRLTIPVAQSLITTLPERRWTTENTQDKLIRVKTDLKTVDKYNKSITYSREHCGYVSRMSTNGMSFIVNILHHQDMGRKGVKIPIVCGRVTCSLANGIVYWIHRRLEFLKDYACVNADGQVVHIFRKGDKSCFVHGIDPGTNLLRVTSRDVEHSGLEMRVDISADAVKPDTGYHPEDRGFHRPNTDYTYNEGYWVEVDLVAPGSAEAAMHENALTEVRWEGEVPVRTVDPFAAVEMPEPSFVRGGW